MSYYKMRSIAAAAILRPACFKIVNGLGLYGSLGAPILIYVASDRMGLYICRRFPSNLPPRWARAPCWTVWPPER